jgi:AcrR family transcriptional regulator
LSRDHVARVALELIDDDGLEALSMGRLAERLGVGTMTLYGYFRNKDELLHAVVDVAVQPTELPRPDGRWRVHLRAVVGAAHSTLTLHPAIVEIRFREPILRPDALRFAERVIGILLEAGFDAREAARAFRLLFTYTFGFAGLSPARTTDEARAQAATAAAGLPPDDFPNLIATAAQWTHAMAGTDEFYYGLDRILDGLEARLEA